MAGIEIVTKLEELCTQDADVHWFCPRDRPDDYNTYYDEDCLDVLDKETEEQRRARQERVKQAERRRDQALEASKILAFEGDEARPYQAKYQNGLSAQMIRCDVCIREFHRSRTLLKGSLEVDFDAEDVKTFMRKFDDMNIQRIAAGLNSATEMLLDVPEHERGITKAGEEGMYAMFEALKCLPFLRDEEMLQRHFGRPFKMCNSRKKIRLPCFAPGMTAFLFSHNTDRSAWANRNFSGVKRDMVSAEFEYSVKPFLQASLARVSVLALQKDFLPTFWSAAKLILSKTGKAVITKDLRTMDANIWKIGLEHFQVDAPQFTDLLACYQMLLEKAPNIFWDAMEEITPQNVLDQIFRSPVLERLFTATNEEIPIHLEAKLAWIEPFICSVKPSNVVGPTRLIVNQMLTRFQEKKYSQHARRVTYETGFGSLLVALRQIKNNLRGGPVVTQMIEIIAKDYIHKIMDQLEGIEKKDSEVKIAKIEQICLEIVETALALDVQSLAYDRYLLENKTTREGDHELSISGLNVWKLSMKHIKPGQPSLPGAVLAGVGGLLPLEKFAPRQLQVEGAEKTTKAWNLALDRALGYVQHDLLGRLEAFSPDQLENIVLDQHACNGIVALLFSGEQAVHQMVLGLLKTLSSEDSRRESLMHLAHCFLGQTLISFSLALRSIAKDKVFAPCLTMLKLCNDIFSCLCDSSDGILRSQTISANNAAALETFWQATWSCIHMIFDQTESWSNKGYDKLMLQDFCRETMDFAAFAFDQYQVFANAVEDAKGAADTSEIASDLLRFPSHTFSKQVRWLRLRDEYLINKAVALACKMLFRLKEVGIVVPDDGSKYVEDIVVSGPGGRDKIKTKLSMNQKAELQRALETHLGEKLDEVVEIEPPVATKYKQSSLAGWTSSGRSTPTAVDAAKPKKAGTIDVEAWNDASLRRKELTSALDVEEEAMLKSMTKSAAEARRRRELEAKVGKSATKPQKDAKSQIAFLERRKKEREEQEARRAAAAAKAKGTTLGAGSGVHGVGDVGKDHSMKGQNVMVSSDEESESEDDMDDDLFGTSKIKEKRDMRKVELPNFEPNGGTGLPPEQRRGPTKIKRTQRNLKDMRARLAPDLAPLHKKILKWDFFHNGDYPPESNEAEFRQVSNSFTDPTTYQQTFQPLLILEAWQGMVKSREEMSSKSYEIKVSSRSNVDSFIEISTSVTHAENRDLQLQEGDIILLSKSKKPVEDASAPNSFARISRIKRTKAHLEVLYQVMPGTPLAQLLTMHAVIYGIKIQSITPLEREYGALQGLQYYDLCNQIIRASPSQRYNVSEKQIQASQDNWNVNRAQAEAISAAMENEGFSLIQGPPGSGKTKTIIAIVGGLLSQALSSVTAVTRFNVPQAANGVKQSSADSGAPRKLLVCAPSNAAVDELVMRLKAGVKTRNGKHHDINIVRIGRSDAINQQVMDVTMDQLVQKKLGTNHDDQKIREKTAEVFKEHQKVSEDLREMLSQRDGGECKGKVLAELENNIAHARKRKNELGIKIDNAKDQERNAGREAELNRKRAQQAVLDEAHVICATLSGSGHDMFQSLNIEFETVIIDEAAQCVEMSSLIPLKYGCVKCIMVGDPKQLPPTVFSKEAARFQYEQSLFVRMQNNFADEVYLLDTQYRMHPDISLFPSRTFYDGLLKDGPRMAGLRKRPWHASALLAPYRFFDVHGEHQSAPRGKSLINLAEIDIAVALYERLVSDFRDYDFHGRIGVITPYKSQLHKLKEKFSTKFGSTIFDTIEFNTTDAFQGRESEIIIFSCVRASPAGGIGFLQDIRRMNVGLTRAKSSLWVLGNSESLARGRYWKQLVEDARSRDSYTTGNLKGMLGKPSGAYPAASWNNSSMLDINEHVPQIDGTGSGRQSAGNTPSTLSERSAMPARVPPQTSSSAMEGVRYRFEDRVKAMKAGSADSSRHPTPLPASPATTPQAVKADVEMEDAASARTGATTPVSRNNSTGVSRQSSETPVATAAAPGKAATSGGDVEPRPAQPRAVPAAGATTTATTAQPAFRKRQANPFLSNNKRPKPR